MGKNNEVKSENNAYFERIKVLEKEVESYRADGEKLGDEILSLRRSVSSYKGANTKLKYDNDQLREEVVKLRNLCREGDELNEQHIAEKERMNGAINEKEKVISGLQEQVQKLILKKQEIESKVDINNEYIAELEKTIDELRMPWWKKILG